MSEWKPVGYEVHHDERGWYAFVLRDGQRSGPIPDCIREAEASTREACERKAKKVVARELAKWEERNVFEPVQVFTTWPPPYRPDPQSWERETVSAHRCRSALTPAGWWCSRDIAHLGPCALRPRWWNLVGRIRFGGMR